MDQELKTYLDEQRTYLEERFEAIDQRFDGIDQRFDGVDQRFDGVDQRIDGVDRRIDGLEEKVHHTHIVVEGLRSDVQAVAEGHAGLEAKIDALREDVRRRRKADLIFGERALASLRESA